MKSFLPNPTTTEKSTVSASTHPWDLSTSVQWEVIVRYTQKSFRNDSSGKGPQRQKYKCYPMFVIATQYTSIGCCFCSYSIVYLPIRCHSSRTQSKSEIFKLKLSLPYPLRSFKHHKLAVSSSLLSLGLFFLSLAICSTYNNSSTH